VSGCGDEGSKLSAKELEHVSISLTEVSVRRLETPTQERHSIGPETEIKAVLDSAWPAHLLVEIKPVVCPLIEDVRDPPRMAKRFLRHLEWVLVAECVQRFVD